MKMPIRHLLAIAVFILPTALAWAQDAAAVRSQLVSSWLATVEGESRLRAFDITGVGEKSPGVYLLEMNYGFIDAPRTPARAEYSAADRKMRIVTGSDSVIEASETANGEFSGTFTPKGGAAKGVKLEKASAQAIEARKNEFLATRNARAFAEEDKDWGIEATPRPRTSDYHAPTPTSVPGGRVLRTLELNSLLQADRNIVVVDVLNGSERTTIPGAYWMPSAGVGVLPAAEKSRFLASLEKLTAGDKGRLVVFLCLSSQCWLSYNAALHAIDAGYKNVAWYRGGTEAWVAARLPRAKAQMVN